MKAWSLVLAVPVLAVVACGDQSRHDGLDATVSEDGAADTTPETVDIDDAHVVGCSTPFRAGPYGVHRGERAADLSLPTVNGELVLSGVVTGCESVIVVPDRLPVSALDATSVWESENDLRTLLATSPDDVHYVFVSTQAAATAATSAIEAMQARVDAVLAGLDGPARDHWSGHLHVVSERAAALPDWPGAALRAHLQTGFAIDQEQIIRGIGSLADVRRFDQTLADAGQWAWRQNLAYLAHEARYMRAETERTRALAGETATVIEVFDGVVLSEFAEADVTFPDADAMSGFDTLTVDITLRCPNPDAPEFGNCGAWDYLARLWLVDATDATKLTEIARFITPYHREAHWVADVTPALAFLADGGARRLRWEFAPSWNTQPTATRMTLRLSQRGTGRPILSIPLFGGGDFGSNYNTGRTPLEVAIPADATRVELWALITGHGAGPNQCAEFCNHQHAFTIGDKTYFHDFPEAADDQGCIAAIDSGMTPNQAGTWWFGRGGWCPGAPVAPWVEDVSAAAPAGQNVTISYEGTLAGRDPPDGSGNIVMTSYLVVFR